MTPFTQAPLLQRRLEKHTEINTADEQINNEIRFHIFFGLYDFYSQQVQSM